ncbi:MAG TPA: hypothetical protein VKV40_13100 [Ktedonobacteraceae bacterium]|nr:hypothetical protein [Ktedonobacteraceae bacterium]
MTDIVVYREKMEQTTRILNELLLDCWLLFVRETDEQPDPALKLIFNHDITWQSAFQAVKGAIAAGKAVLRPGVQGWQVDEAARSYLV